jgi:hypothetical protein
LPAIDAVHRLAQNAEQARANLGILVQLLAHVFHVAIQQVAERVKLFDRLVGVRHADHAGQCIHHPLAALGMNQRAIALPFQHAGLDD